MPRRRIATAATLMDLSGPALGADRFDTLHHDVTWLPPTLGLLAGLHLIGAAAWIGGMATMHFAVRPAAQRVLDAPPLRLRFMGATLDRFLRLVDAAVALLWASGLGLLALSGADHPHWSVTAMIGIASFMTVVFLQIRWQLQPRLRSAVGLSQWPAAVDALAAIRRRVGLNLALGIAIFPIVLVGRALP